ncbi:MAG: hypothetical protein PHC86_06060 [Eubacteriales bacterium]|nr:hypothetical protein [Eubacteriales bacterium]
MKSQTRTWILTVALTLLWSTPIVLPFRYFAQMLANIATWLMAQINLSIAFEAFGLIVLLVLALSAFFWLDRSRNRVYLAGFIALAEVAYHIWMSFRTKSPYDIPLPITIGLSLALLFLLISNKLPGVWLSDAYVMAIPAWLLVETVLAGLFDVMHWPGELLKPILIIPDQSLIFKLEDYLGLPILVWSVLVLILTLMPLIFLAKGRAKG